MAAEAQVQGGGWEDPPFRPSAGSALFRKLGALAGGRVPWPTATARHLPLK